MGRDRQRTLLRRLSALLATTLALGALAAVATAGDAATPRYGFELTQQGKPVTFQPCRALTWRLNLNGAPPEQRANVQYAFRQVAAATGFRFVAWSDSTVIPMRKRNNAALADADILFAFATTGKAANQTNIDLADSGDWDTLGRGGFSSTLGSFALGGNVVIDLGDVPNLSTVEQQRLYMHELAHAVGLGHSRDASAVMAPVAADGAAAWSTDDLAGLAAIGKRAGCLPRRGTPPLVTRPLPDGQAVELPPGPANIRLDDRTFRWDPDATAQTGFYTARLAHAFYADDAWGPWTWGKTEYVMLPIASRLKVTLPAGWSSTETQAVAIVVRGFNQRGYRETTFRTRASVLQP